MIKATTTQNGRTVLMLGLSFRNLERFRAEPLDTFIKVDGREMDLPIDVLIFSGETEQGLAEFMREYMAPHTQVRGKH